ncbi:AMP-binding protein [Nonomuraea jabiensis]|uniref:Amino acid adenylation domain-containing protein n=1 Tax=Nonomuraea jabiensis TaxID=882448 RepID=A0A7W9G0M1_9ACTN|nr:AMP-binding protein [Nonomuraea jabiensis]MBB5774966.1 amino acid adenylation domain-containing protein [Nonomuraea jabiensis]
MSLHAGVSHAVRHRPDATALIVQGRRVTFAELWSQVGGIAAGLLDRFGEPPPRIAVMSGPRLLGFAGALACSVLGAAWVPINPAHPRDRVAAILRSAEPGAVVCEQEDVPLLEAAARAAGVEERVPFLVSPPSGSSVPEESPGEGFAYIFFTSGSTGSPKGVPITRANLQAFLDWVGARYRLSPEDVVAQFSDLSFDLSILSTFGAWAGGAAVAVLDRRDMVLAPERTLGRAGCSAWVSVPSLARLLSARRGLRPGAFPGLRLSLFCGEALPRDVVEEWQTAAPDSVIENLYGPTEATVACFAYSWDGGTSPSRCANDVVPIGHPMPGTLAAIVDPEHGRPADSGELLLGGTQCFAGYWRDARRTAASLVRLGDSAKVYYRTGDLVRRDADGCLHFVGRADRQIKVNGHRVELGDIEAAMNALPGVRATAALGWPVVGLTAEGVAAFVVSEECEPATLRSRLRDALPAYMMPSRVQVLPELPLTANGKTDYRALITLLEGARG